MTMGYLSESYVISAYFDLPKLSPGSDNSLYIFKEGKSFDKFLLIFYW
jgi:hypothetical protein